MADEEDDNHFEETREQQKYASLYVENLLKQINNEGLYNLFSRFGEIRNVSVVPSKKHSDRNIGFVNFTSYSFAVRAIECMNEKPPHFLRVKFKNSRENRHPFEDFGTRKFGVKPKPRAYQVYQDTQNSAKNTAVANYSVSTIKNDQREDAVGDNYESNYDLEDCDYDLNKVGVEMIKVSLGGDGRKVVVEPTITTISITSTTTTLSARQEFSNTASNFRETIGGRGIERRHLDRRTDKQNFEGQWQTRRMEEEQYYSDNQSGFSYNAYDRLPRGRFLYCTVSHVEQEDMIWVQTNFKILCWLTNEINSRHIQPDCNFNIRIDTKCLVQHNSSWYRGKIVRSNTKNHTEFQVLLIDYGNIVTVAKSQIAPPCETDFDCSPLAIKCKASPDVKVNFKNFDSFRNTLLGKKTELIVTHHFEGIPVVYLKLDEEQNPPAHDQSSRRPKFENHGRANPPPPDQSPRRPKFENHGRANPPPSDQSSPRPNFENRGRANPPPYDQSSRMPNFENRARANPPASDRLPPKPRFENIKQDVPSEPTASEEAKLKNVNPPNIPEKSVSDDLIPKPILNGLPPSDDLPQTSDVVITLVNSAENICVIPTACYERLAEMMGIINSQTEVDDPYTPIVGDLVCTKYTDDIFYRSEVLDVNANEVLVQFVDYGNTEKVPFNLIRPMPAKARQFPQFGYTVALARKPMTLEPLKQLIEPETPAQMKIRNKSTPILVEFFSEGAPILTEQAECSRPIRPRPRDANTLPVKSIAKPVRLPLKLGVIAATLTRLEGKNIYFIPRDELDQTIDLLGELKDFDPGDEAYTPTTGELCLAYDDDNWNRAECTEVTTDGKFKVLSIDFGHVDEVGATCLRPCPKQFAERPGLAVKCVIEGFPENAAVRNKLKNLDMLVDDILIEIIEVHDDHICIRLK